MINFIFKWGIYKECIRECLLRSQSRGPRVNIFINGIYREVSTPFKCKKGYDIKSRDRLEDGRSVHIYSRNKRRFMGPSRDAG